MYAVGHDEKQPDSPLPSAAEAKSDHWTAAEKQGKGQQGKNVTANCLYYQTMLFAGSVRIKKCAHKRKRGLEINTSERHIVEGAAERKKDQPNTYVNAIVPASVRTVTPCKRHVVKREMPPSPFDLNLAPITRSITEVGQKYKCFEEHDGEDLDRYGKHNVFVCWEN